MPNIFHQSVEDVLKAATPEQRLLWNYIFLRWGERVPIAQLYYQGNTAGTEFLTYSANKLYVAYSIQFFSTNPAATGLGTAVVNLYDELNAVTITSRNIALYWDNVAAALGVGFLPLAINNCYFSRFLDGAGVYTRMKFIGYRIGI